MLKKIATVLFFIPLLAGCSPSISGKNVHSSNAESKLASTDSLNIDVNSASDSASAVRLEAPLLIDVPNVSQNQNEPAIYPLSLDAIKFCEFADSVANSLVVSKKWEWQH